VKHEEVSFCNTENSNFIIYFIVYLCLQPSSNGVEKKKKKDKEAKKSKKKQEASKPMHFTANNEPRALDVLGDLDPNIFNECKEKMRPVKKSLKALDGGHGAEDHASHRRECILKIGKHIDDCLAEHKDPVKIKEWRSRLWYFVSKFTEDNASKLFKLYKSEKAKENGTESPTKSEKKEKKSHHKSQDSNDKKKDKKHKEHSTSKSDHRDLHEKYRTFDDDMGESYGKRRLEREEGEIDEKEYKRTSNDAR
jgi:hypothetical protein